MSNKRFFKRAKARRDRYANIEAANEIRSFFRGGVDAELSIAEILEIKEVGNRTTSDERSKVYGKIVQALKKQGKSRFDRFVAGKAFNGNLPRNDDNGIDFSRMLADFKVRQQINKGMRLSLEEGISLSSLSLEHDAGAFEKLGFTHWWEVVRFSRLWEKVENKTRGFCSPYQPFIKSAIAVALTPNYNRLPAWVREGLVKYAPEAEGVLGGDRIGNIWRLPDCVRAWKWCRYLPKRVAERVGRMPVRARILSPLAWAIAFEETKVIVVEQRWGDQRRVPGDRADQVARFWVELRRLAALPLLQQIAEFESTLKKDDDYNNYGYRQFKDNFPRRGILALVSHSTSFPWVFITEKVDSLFSSYNTVEYWAGFFAQYGDSRTTCRLIFGSAGKATVKAFSECRSAESWRWASAIGEGNADAIQKFLRLPADAVISFEQDAVQFLLSLPMSARLRLLTAKTFKYRGVEYEISKDHVKDTGYLYSRIVATGDTPRLGRVRCWFSAHEALAEQYVESLPDEALPIPRGWERLDGVAAVDQSWEIRFPRSVAELKRWGSKEVLDNCVGGYGAKIKANQSVIFTVLDESANPTHCIEYTPSGHCEQFYSKGNRQPDSHIKDAVQRVIRLAGLSQ